MINYHITILRWQRLVLVLLLDINGIPPLLFYKFWVFTCILFYKGLVGNNLICKYDKFITLTNVLDKLRNLLLLLNLPETKSRIIIIPKYVSHINEVLGIKGYRTIKALRINKDWITSIFNILPYFVIYFETLQIVNSLIQIIVWVGEKSPHGGDIDLGYGSCQWHHYQLLLKKTICQCYP